MSERDELVLRILDLHVQSARNGHCTCGWRPTWPDGRIGAATFQHRDHLADAILAHLRPEVTTPEELDALPEGTLFRSGDRLGRLWAHHASALDGGGVWADKHDALPLVVLA